MSAPENGARNINMDTEAVVVTSLESSSVEGFSNQEHNQDLERLADASGKNATNAGEVKDSQERTLDLEWLLASVNGNSTGKAGEVNDSQDPAIDLEKPLVDTNGKSVSKTSEVNGSNGNSDQDIAPSLNSLSSSAGNMPPQADSCSEEVSGGANEAAAAKDHEQSEVQRPTPSDLDTQPRNKTSRQSLGEEIVRTGEAVLMKNKTEKHETNPIVTAEAAGHSVPPHMREGFAALVAHQAILSQSRGPPRNWNTCGNNLPQWSNYSSPLQSSGYNIPPQISCHYGILPEEIVRLNAQMLKIQSDLDDERTKNRNLRQQFESEQREHLEAAFSGMLSDLLRGQMTVVALKASYKAKLRDLAFRERSAIVTEKFLAEGQRYLVRKLDGQEDKCLMREAELENVRQQMKLEIHKHFRDREAELSVKGKEVRLRADVQQKREEQYETLIKQVVDEEISAKKAEEQYQRGVANGRELGKKEAMQEMRKKKFLEGYHACFRAQAALSAFRKGELARDSPELAFLFDLAHPDNMLNMGFQIGQQLELPDAAESEASGVEENDPARKGKSEDGAQGIKANDGIIENNTRDIVDESNTAPAPVRRIHSASPPRYARPTLAAELRGPSPLYNGRVILANNAAHREPDPQPTRAPTVPKYGGEDNLIDLL